MKKKIFLFLVLLLVAFVAMSGTEAATITTETTTAIPTITSDPDQSQAIDWDKLNEYRWENERWIRYFPICVLTLLTVTGVLKAR